MALNLRRYKNVVIAKTSTPEHKSVGLRWYIFCSHPEENGSKAFKTLKQAKAYINENREQCATYGLLFALKSETVSFWDLPTC